VLGSAPPTPWAPAADGQDWAVDWGVTDLMVGHHARVGVPVIFPGGTNGEGKLMTLEQFDQVVQGWRTVGQGKTAVDSGLIIVANATENSPSRVIRRIEIASDAGADCVMIAPPPDHNAVWAPAIADDMLSDVLDNSCLPVMLYDLDCPYRWPIDVFCAGLAHKNVIGAKVSSEDPARWRDILAVRDGAKRDLVIYGGIEFRGDEQLNAGMDGLLTGAAFATHWLSIQQINSDDPGERAVIQGEITAILTRLFGGNPYGNPGTPLRWWQTGQRRLLEYGLGGVVKLNGLTGEHLLWGQEGEDSVRTLFEKYGELMFPKAA